MPMNLVSIPNKNFVAALLALSMVMVSGHWSVVAQSVLSSHAWTLRLVLKDTLWGVPTSTIINA